jgi:hypothetical protein
VATEDSRNAAVAWCVLKVFRESAARDTPKLRTSKNFFGHIQSPDWLSCSENHIKIISVKPACAAPSSTSTPRCCRDSTTLETDLIERRKRAAAEGWLGEIEGID